MPDRVLSCPISGESDLLALAALSESLVDALIECEHGITRLALCGRLVCVLEGLKHALEMPIPPHCIDALTGTTQEVDASPFLLGAESQTLRGYCHGLALLLLSGALLPETEKMVTGLLFDLVNHLKDDLRRPCFIREKAESANLYGMQEETFSCG